MLLALALTLLNRLFGASRPLLRDDPFLVDDHLDDE
jgi:hypothetical protein